MTHRFQKLLFGALIGGALSLNGLAMQAPAAKTKAAVKTAATAPTDQEIADAKAKNMVWVNTTTKAYHTSADAKYYGKTHHGKFMSEDDAKKAGYHAAGAHTPKPSAAKK